MEETIVKFIWAILPSLTVGVLMAIYNNKQKKRDDSAAERERDRIKSETLRISLLVATAQLSYATTMAMKRGSTNGEVEPAVQQYERAMNKFRDFEREQMARAVAE